MTMLAELTWEETQARAADSVLAVPLGSTEQHGPHLPLGTDTEVAMELARRLAEARPRVLVAPGMAYGASGEHAGFAGTLSIGIDALGRMLLELARSADAFAAVVVVCAHGGNAAALEGACRLAVAEGRRLLAWTPDRALAAAGTDAHAGRTETSLLLALRPDAVRRERVVAGDRRPVAELMASLRAGGIASVSPNGVLGDPRGASAAEGESLLSVMTADLVAVVDALPAVVGRR